MASAACLLRLLDVNFALGVACLTTAGCLNRLRQVGSHARRQGSRGLSASTTGSAGSAEAALSDCLMHAEVQCIALLRQASRILPGQLLHNGIHLCLNQGPDAAHLAWSAANSRDAPADLFFGVVPDAQHCFILVFGSAGPESRVLQCSSGGGLVLGPFRQAHSAMWRLQVQGSCCHLQNKQHPEQCLELHPLQADGPLKPSSRSEHAPSQATRQITGSPSNSTMTHTTASDAVSSLPASAQKPRRRQAPATPQSSEYVADLYCLTSRGEAAQIQVMKEAQDERQRRHQHLTDRQMAAQVTLQSHGRDSGDEQLAATAQLHAVSDAADQVLQHTASSLHGYLQGKHPRLSWLRQLASHLQADLRCSEQAHTALQRLCTHHLTRQLSNLQEEKDTCAQLQQLLEKAESTSGMAAAKDARNRALQLQLAAAVQQQRAAEKGLQQVKLELQQARAAAIKANLGTVKPLCDSQPAGNPGSFSIPALHLPRKDAAQPDSGSSAPRSERCQEPMVTLTVNRAGSLSARAKTPRSTHAAAPSAWPTPERASAKARDRIVRQC